MPLEKYGVLKGRAIARRLGEGASPHYQIHIIDDDLDYRIAVNVKSAQSPSELLYLIDEQFRHPLLADLGGLRLGFTLLPSQPGGQALDFIRGNLFDRTQMRTLPFNVPGPDNDLNEALDRHVSRALADEKALVYAFGQRWGPENKKDAYFGFKPGNGIHDIHMNQGNVAPFLGDDGVWQDGGLLIHFPQPEQWVAIFLKFQSQAWHTDDKTGHTIATSTPPGEPDGPVHPGEPDHVARIVAALVNPVGPAPERETVTLINASPQAINLAGWAIADRQKNRQRLSGTLAPGATVVVALAPPVALGNQGGIITLLNAQGLKVDGVSYTAAQAREGWTVVF